MKKEIQPKDWQWQILKIHEDKGLRLNFGSDGREHWFTEDSGGLPIDAIINEIEAVKFLADHPKAPRKWRLGR